jgi:3-hydroxyacyl-[acyl-carrier-protein] dehydratase
MPEAAETTIELSQYDYQKPMLGVEEINQVLPHRHEMFLLSGLVHLDRQKHTIVGFKDLRHDEFWVRGHFPRFAVMPGVLMVEASAQLTALYMTYTGILSPDRLVGLGGIEETRFREPVRPGERLVLLGQGLRVSSRITRFSITGHVQRAGKYEVAFETIILGVPLGKWEDLAGA